MAGVFGCLDKARAISEQGLSYTATGSRVQNRLSSWWSGRFRPEAVDRRRALPPGVDEVRLLRTADAEALAGLVTTLAILDQAIDAMRLLIERQRTKQTDPVADIALLQFAVTQFVSGFKVRRGSRRLSPKQAFDATGARYFEHIVALADQLSGAQPRLTGQTEVVVLLKRAGNRAAMVGLTTRSRPPDRLTIQELTGIADFMGRGRDAYAAAARLQRERLIEAVSTLNDDELLALDQPDTL